MSQNSVDDSADLSYSEKRRRIDDSEDLSGHVESIRSALEKIDKVYEGLEKENTHSTITRVASEIKLSLDELKLKLEKERQSFAEALSIEEEKVEQKKLFVLYEQLKNKEQEMLGECQEEIAIKMAQLAESLPHRKQDKAVIVMFKTIAEYFKRTRS